MNRQLLSLTFLVLGLIALFVPVSQAQSQVPETRESVIESIKETAQRHARYGEPMKSEFVLPIYKDNKAGLTPADIVETYEKEYVATKQEHETPPPHATESAAGSTLPLSQAVWTIGVLVLLGCVAAVVWILWSNRNAPTLDRPILGHVHAPRNFRIGSMRRYRTRLLHQYQELKLPIDAGKSPRLRDLYVTPLAGSPNGEVLDPNTFLARHRRLLLTGAPGSGKSLFLRFLALASVDGGPSPLPEPLTPVLIELQGLGTTRSLHDTIIYQLGHLGIGQAEAFAKRRLESGNLLLLLDGLDEVKSTLRPQVIGQIKELLAKYPSCRAVVTSRPIAGAKELVASMDASLELRDFTDRQVRHFLTGWKNAVAAERAFTMEPLLKSLREQDQLLYLARNPLLVTMIAALYVEKPRGFPGTRAVLYRQCMDATLTKTRADQGRYTKETKFEILSRLALAMLDHSELPGESGLTLERSQAAHEVRRILADLKRSSASGIDAADLVRELIERDHVLIQIEGACRFRHRTWQEYLAAEAIDENCQCLIDRFRRDPETWLETVKFYCGLDHNCTSLVEALGEVDPAAALSCLSEAKQVDLSLANRVVAGFKDRLGSAELENCAIYDLAGCATQTAQRGEAVLQFLVQTLSAAENPPRRHAAARALALTSLPSAAREISRLYTDGAEFRSALVYMGDQAVAQLAALARAGSVEALDDLQTIGTPAAAEALVPLLWEATGELPVRAAWRLASLLHQPQVEQVLETYSFSGARPAPGTLDWIWEPFSRSDRSPLPLIIGQAAALLERAPLDTAPRERPTLDARFVLPLCALVKKQEAWRLTDELPGETKTSIRRALINAVGRPVYMRLSNTTKEPIGSRVREARAQFVALLLHVTQASKSWLYFVDSLRPEIQFAFLYGLYRGPTPRRWDWLALRQAGKHAAWIPPGIQGVRARHSESAPEQSPTSRQNGTGQTTRADGAARRPGTGPFRMGLKTGAGQ
jgi:hypothetical protein